MMERYLVALVIVGLGDAFSYMVVAPSLIFYVTQQGGSKEAYGIIISAFSFASFCVQPFLGAWTDRVGFRTPYFSSLLLAACGGALYLVAPLCSSTFFTILLILLGRLLGGAGSASSLGPSYITEVVPYDKQTRVNSILSTLRIMGMAVGPALNMFLDKVDLKIGPLAVDSLNAVGLVLIACNVVGLLSVFLLLDEPPRDWTYKPPSAPVEGLLQQDTWESYLRTAKSLIKPILCPEILLQIFSLIRFNANFQLVETCFTPAAGYSLGWGPIQTSSVLGTASIVIFVVMWLVYELSARKVRDEHLLMVGLIISTCSYSNMYFSWTLDSPKYRFYMPVITAAASFPFLAAPTRSLYTKAVDADPVLREYSAGMQALLSMAASVAGFVTPGVLAARVLRHPAEVEASPHNRALTPLALFAPILSILTIIGLVVRELKQKCTTAPSIQQQKMPEEVVATEETLLVSKHDNGHARPHGRSAPQLRRFSSPFRISTSRHSASGRASRRYSGRIQARRRQSVSCMGIAQFSHVDDDDDVFELDNFRFSTIQELDDEEDGY